MPATEQAEHAKLALACRCGRCRRFSAVWSHRMLRVLDFHWKRFICSQNSVPSPPCATLNVASRHSSPPCSLCWRCPPFHCVFRPCRSAHAWSTVAVMPPRRSPRGRRPPSRRVSRPYCNAKARTVVAVPALSVLTHCSAGCTAAAAAFLLSVLWLTRLPLPSRWLVCLAPFFAEPPRRLAVPRFFCRYYCRDLFYCC